LSYALWLWRQFVVGRVGSSILRQLIALSLIPFVAHAGVAYEVATRPVDQSNIAPVSAGAPASTPVVTQYFVEDGRVRIGGPRAKLVYLFEDRTMYVIDNTARSVHVLKHATLSQLAAHYADAVKQLESAAANAQPDEREEAQRKAADMKEVSERMRQTVPRDFHVTVRFESVDGHACRIWEESEKEAKRLELCVAPAATIPGGAEILNGWKTMSQFRQGSNFALGIEFGLSEWWPDFSMLGGVPILIREYKYDSEVSETMVSAIRPGVAKGTQFDLPEGYQVQEGPDYTQWYLR
jgi:hypothetical protein